MKPNFKHLSLYTEYEGTKYRVYIDKENKEQGKYVLIDYENSQIVKRANKVEKLDKFIYGG